MNFNVIIYKYLRIVNCISIPKIAFSKQHIQPNRNDDNPAPMILLTDNTNPIICTN